MSAKIIYQYNDYYFKQIDDSHKAYWIGYIWCDGCARITERGNFNFSLVSVDRDQLEKIREDLNGDFKIHLLSHKTEKNRNKIYEISLNSERFVNVLMNDFGLVVDRNDCSKIISSIPKKYYKDFIRGILDANGSFSESHVMVNHKYPANVVRIKFGAQLEILNFINRVLFEQGLIKTETRKFERPYNNNYYVLAYCGAKQSIDIMSYLYDNADIYMNRKYKKYQKIKTDVKNFDWSK